MCVSSYVKYSDSISALAPIRRLPMPDDGPRIQGGAGTLRVFTTVPAAFTLSS